MLLIARQIAITGALIFIVWLAFDRFWNRFPIMREHVDSSSPHASLLHASEIAQIVGELHVIANHDDARILFIGSSDMQIAFRPAQVRTLFPKYRVDNLSRNGKYGGGSVGEDLRIIRFARAVMTPMARSESVFVVGLSYSAFFSRRIDEDESDLVRAQKTMFPRLFRSGGGEAGASPKLYALSARALRPLFAARRFWELCFRQQNWDFARAWLNTPPDTMSDKECIDTYSHLDLPNGLKGDVSGPTDAVPALLQTKTSSNYRNLSELLLYAKRERVKLIIVILPTLPLSMERYPEYDFFTLQMQDAVEALDSSNVWFLDMSKLLGNGCFRDRNHIVNEAAPLCALELKRRWPISEAGDRR